MKTIKPREDGCYVYFHPTTVKVLDVIEELGNGWGYSLTKKVIAEKCGISERTVYRHLDALESVEYIARDFHGGITQQMSMNEEIDYSLSDCEGYA